MTKKTILIVEDNPVNRKLLLVVLRPHGYRLLTANDGTEAIELAAREQPDLILMDLQLPRLNGYAAARHLKSQSITAHIPIIALTAHAITEANGAFSSDFDGYLNKPIDTRAFPKKVAAWLDGKDSTQEW